MAGTVHAVHNVSSDSDRDQRARRLEKPKPVRRVAAGHAGLGSSTNPVDLTDEVPSTARHNISASTPLTRPPVPETVSNSTSVLTKIDNNQSHPLRNSVPVARRSDAFGRVIQTTEPPRPMSQQSLQRNGPYGLKAPTTLEQARREAMLNNSFGGWPNLSTLYTTPTKIEDLPARLGLHPHLHEAFRTPLEPNKVFIKLRKPQCIFCMEQRIGCDGEQPCSTCAEPGIDCIYPIRGNRQATTKTETVAITPTTSNLQAHNRNAAMIHTKDRQTIAKGPHDPPDRRESFASRDPQPNVPGSVSDVNNATQLSSDESDKEFEAPIPLEPQAFERILRKYEMEMKAFQEYLLQPRLRQNRLHMQKISPPKLEPTAESAFSRLRSTSQHTSSRPYMQIQVKDHASSGQTNKNKWKTVNCPMAQATTDAESLPKYKSIGRVGPSLLAQNIRTSKYRPYDAADEHIEDAAITRKYNELMQRYEHNDESMKAQRKCLELVDLWTPWAAQVMQRLDITYADVVYFYLHDSDVGWRPDVAMSDAAWSAWTVEQRAACKTCRIEENWDKHGKWDNIPMPSARAFAAAGLAAHAFHKVVQVSLWHIASTAESVKAVLKQTDEKELKVKPVDSGLCAICYLHNCPTHGQFYESDGEEGDEDQEAVINHDEVEHNARILVALPTQEAGEMAEHLCGPFCVDLSKQTTDLLGRGRDGLVTGSCRSIRETRSGFREIELCGSACFWDTKNRRRCKISELDRGNISPLSRQQWELFEVVLPLHINNRRAPCLIARIIGDVTCMNVFYHMLYRLIKIPHTISLLSDQIESQTRKISKLQLGIDTSNSAELDKRCPFLPCSHEGPCHNNPDCTCAENKIYCEWFCGCDHACKRRFKGCICASVNKTCFKDDRCECWSNARECDPFLCKGCGVVEVLDSTNKYNDDIQKGRCKNNRIQLDRPARTIKAPSEVQGYGLFAGEDLDEHAYIGEYRGEIVSSAESDRRGAFYHILGAEYLFVLNNEQQMDASHVGNKMRFMNNSQKDSNINVLARKALCNGIQRVMLYAKRPIKAGEELLYNYNYPATVTKKFWERGEKPSTAASAVVALGPKTTTTNQTSPQPRVNGRFARKSQGGRENLDLSEDDIGQSSSKRKRSHRSVVNSSPMFNMATSNDVTMSSGPDQKMPPRRMQVSDRSGSEEISGPTEESDEEANLTVKRPSTMSKTQTRDVSRRVTSRDRRRGGVAQAAAWQTRIKNQERQEQLARNTK